MKQLSLNKNLAFFDLETTGTNPDTDRIVSIAVKVIPKDGGQMKSYYSLINPERHIPNESAEVHGITDDQVKMSPKFKEVAPLIMDLFEDADIGGYNILQFDVPLLINECKRVGITFPSANTFYVDIMKIFKTKERRDLAGALKFYTGKVISDAHNAMGDVDTTIDVFTAMIERYDDFPTTAEQIQLYANEGIPMVDLAGKLKRNEKGIIVYAFGKAINTPVVEDHGFGQWMLGQSFFTTETKARVKEILAGTLK